jgi:hypothetical protein
VGAGRMDGMGMVCRRKDWRLETGDRWDGCGAVDDDVRR